MSKKTEKLIWIDIETTGLNPDKDKIVEIATLITDDNLNVITEGPDLVIHQPEEILSSMDNWNKEHFTQSGLLYQIRESKISLAEAEAQTLEFIKANCRPQTAMFAGSSVHFDREFVRISMPKIVEYMHHRIIDVSTVKELAYRWYPNLPVFPKADAHRAHDDILESIDELKYYKAQVFK